LECYPEIEGSWGPSHTQALKRRQDAIRLLDKNIRELNRSINCKFGIFSTKTENLNVFGQTMSTTECVFLCDEYEQAEQYILAEQIKDPFSTTLHSIKPVEISDV
jgi:hypothetical protein